MAQCEIEREFNKLKELTEIPSRLEIDEVRTLLKCLSLQNIFNYVTNF